ncbi:nucleotidyl transferase AbiEii/AbiGii toxin family protein [Candidatus Parcubacteria bacterium]|nr:nucleotidyl transferase AbiEii/AbiGii toxin family protein [Patescibacteria group bacterium]MCG2688353.1 nucleotidyl transferase AbiEii/AbiGii toxin family protein [Candidatus Parcubacteria bacterium]
MGKKVTTPEQEKFLDFVSAAPALREHFYFTGGTALSKFYLRHRFSEDLDFFSEKEFDVKDITPFLFKAKQALCFRKIDYQQSFNRNIFHLLFSGKRILKVEFTYFPFPQIEKPMEKQGLSVDSLKDIAVNKVFTINQNPRGRDFFDLYWILKKGDWSVLELLRQARIKFDWHIDPIQCGSQFLKSGLLLDDPILIKKGFDYGKMRKFFEDLSGEIGKKGLRK